MIARYADAVPLLIDLLERDPRSKELVSAPAQYQRWLYYNVYTVPWRAFEMLDVLERIRGNGGVAGRALDLGCGFGAMGLYLALDGGAASVVGMDRKQVQLELMSEVLEAASERRLQLVRGDVTRPPFDARSFDLVLFYDVLYHPEIDRARALRRAYSMLRTDGVVLIKVFNRACPPFALAALPGVRDALRRAAARSNIEQRVLQLVQPAAPTSFGIRDELRRAGFTGVQVFNRYTRRPRGGARWVLPDLIVGGIRAR